MKTHHWALLLVLFAPVAYVLLLTAPSLYWYHQGDVDSAVFFLLTVAWSTLVSAVCIPLAIRFSPLR